MKFFIVAMMSILMISAAQAFDGVRDELESGKDLIINLSDLASGRSGGDFYVELRVKGGEGLAINGEIKDVTLRRIPLAKLKKGESDSLNKKVLISSKELKDLIEKELKGYEHLEFVVQLGNNGVEAERANQGLTVFHNKIDGQEKYIFSDMHIHDKTFSTVTVAAEVREMTTEERLQRILELLNDVGGHLDNMIETIDSDQRVDSERDSSVEVKVEANVEEASVEAAVGE